MLHFEVVQLHKAYLNVGSDQPHENPSWEQILKTHNLYVLRELFKFKLND